MHEDQGERDREIKMTWKGSKAWAGIAMMRKRQQRNGIKGRLVARSCLWNRLVGGRGEEEAVEEGWEGIMEHRWGGGGRGKLAGAHFHLNIVVYKTR
jgi:hypothetical protein